MSIWRCRCRCQELLFTIGCNVLARQQSTIYQGTSSNMHSRTLTQCTMQRKQAIRLAQFKIATIFSAIILCCHAVLMLCVLSTPMKSITLAFWTKKCSNGWKTKTKRSAITCIEVKYALVSAVSTVLNTIPHRKKAKQRTNGVYISMEK